MLLDEKYELVSRPEGHGCKVVGVNNGIIYANTPYRELAECVLNQLRFKTDEQRIRRENITLHFSP